MDQISTFIDLFLHIDDHLREFATEHGAWVYGLLFVIVFVETGVVIMPLLPGDSLLFAAGALAGIGAVKLVPMLLLLTAAAILGDSANYAIGRWIGPRVFAENRRFLNREHLLRTQRFYERHGGKTIVLARFVPIVRTFAPFVAGVGKMHYPRFLAYNVAGGVAWVWSFGLLGYFFGEQPVVEENFGLFIIGIIVLSMVPIFVEMWRARRAASARGARPSAQDPD